MSLISNGIESVRAFELPAGIRTNGRAPDAPRVALVKWQSAWSDKFHQIYVNGRYTGTTLDNHQRQMIVPIPTSLESPIRIEVFAVDAENAGIDFSSELAQSSIHSGRVKLTLLRSQTLPIGATANVYYDNSTGEIDYEHPLNKSPIRIWPTWQDKVGFAMSQFGLGDFGYDSAAAIGFGKGSFGYGLFGLDADTIEWTSSPLPTGAYRFGVRIRNESGDRSAPSETGPITVIPAARPADHLSIYMFDKPTNQLVLEIKNTA